MNAGRMRLPLRALVQPSFFTGICQARHLHAGRPQPTIPEPIPLIPDVATFLTVIGRGLKQHAEKFPSWESLFSLTSPQLKELGIEPPRTRRYLLQWLQRYRNGLFGPGGDFKYVHNGEAILKVATKPKTAIEDLNWVVNVPPGAEIQNLPEEERTRAKGYTIHGARSISGPYATPLKSSNGARVKVTEGMWENKRGRKIDGGERRRAEVRFRRKVAQRKAERESQYQ
jgi:hypothetical protein